MGRKQDPDEPKIYFLPNLMTACNLACGFFAVLMILKGAIEVEKMSIDGVALPWKEYIEISRRYYEYAILLIFGSCLFDLLDGRLARLGGQDSPFGREFDSLADIISFGMAPAMLLSRAVLFEFDRVGWAIALIYLVCGAMRLARFNCLALVPKKPNASHDFRGLPIPMAAGFIASLTFLLIDIYQNDRELGFWKFVLAGAMLGLSLLMISDVRYPSFKKVGLRTRGTVGAIVISVLLLLITVQFRYTMPVVLFSIYLLYGLFRPLLSPKMRTEIEVEDGDDEPPPAEEEKRPEETMSSEASPGRPKWLVILIVGLPAWLVGSAVVGIWHKAKKENASEAETAKLLVQQISTPAVADDLKKLVGWIGERNGAGEDAAEGLRRTASWIEGSLGPGNVGHTVEKIRGPAGFPLLHAIQPGSDPKEPALWVLAGYDSRQGSPGVEANGTGVSAVLAACRAIAGDVTKASVHYLFLPHVYDEESPVMETASSAAGLIRSQGTAGRVLVVEALGSGPSLWLSSRAPEIVPEALAEGLGGIKGAEVVCLGEDTDLASILFEMGLPGIRVSTRPLVTADEDDSAPADPVKVAAAAENLLRFIRRCAQNP